MSHPDPDHGDPAVRPDQPGDRFGDWGADTVQIVHDPDDDEADGRETMPPCPEDRHDWDEIVEYRNDPDGWLGGTGVYRCTHCGANSHEHDPDDELWP